MKRIAALLLAACGQGHLTPGSEPLVPVEHTTPPPVVISTYTITGADDIDDTFLNISDMATSWGGYGTIWYGGSYFWRPLVRVSVAGLPDAGTVAEVRFRFHVGDLYNGGYQTTLHAYRVSAPWLEGYGGGEVAPGATWSSTGMAPWASGGCGSSGVDYVADDSPPTINPVEGWNTWTLPASWFEAWRAGEPNNGFIVFPAPEGGPGNFNQWLSSESGDKGPSFEVDLAQ